MNSKGYSVLDGQELKVTPYLMGKLQDCQGRLNRRRGNICFVDAPCVCWCLRRKQSRGKSLQRSKTRPKARKKPLYLCYLDKVTAIDISNQQQYILLKAACISFVKSCSMYILGTWTNCSLLKAKQQHAYILAIWKNCFLLKPACICIFYELEYVVGLIYIT
ncbi:hypothetical protein DVH24_041510 [Malus domestica]|uniref:Uncharacterized protein n=1 Tax=Malus domestica TaxID=3750 RepID=A0A498IGI4_MALDO|nr:hypothetical protein DVH24_041510 [Malus domestica]